MKTGLITRAWEQAGGYGWCVVNDGKLFLSGTCGDAMEAMQLMSRGVALLLGRESDNGKSVERQRPVGCTSANCPTCKRPFGSPGNDRPDPEPPRYRPYGGALMDTAKRETHYGADSPIPSSQSVSRPTPSDKPGHKEAWNNFCPHCKAVSGAPCRDFQGKVMLEATHGVRNPERKRDLTETALPCLWTPCEKTAKKGCRGYCHKHYKWAFGGDR